METILSSYFATPQGVVEGSRQHNMKEAKLRPPSGEAHKWERSPNWGMWTLPRKHMLDVPFTPCQPRQLHNVFCSPRWWAWWGGAHDKLDRNNNSNNNMCGRWGIFFILTPGSTLPKYQHRFAHDWLQDEKNPMRTSPSQWSPWWPPIEILYIERDVEMYVYIYVHLRTTSMLPFFGIQSTTWNMIFSVTYSLGLHNAISLCYWCSFD